MRSFVHPEAPSFPYRFQIAVIHYQQTVRFREKHNVSNVLEWHVTTVTTINMDQIKLLDQFRVLLDKQREDLCGVPTDEVMSLLSESSLNQFRRRRGVRVPATIEAQHRSFRACAQPSGSRVPSVEPDLHNCGQPFLLGQLLNAQSPAHIVWKRSVALKFPPVVYFAR
eukprot:TRINITY_DN68001_c13_g1_i2.p2 TRINITY_DN68001_c13_g1~~TRINITY_DN68001_c13_g1_i2.p2  ORF type:complete len:168 (+),score=4.15 TRINITY_DN68001_c13_g1_i2:409-912(+)